MKRTVNELVQLQELLEAQAQREVMTVQPRLAQLAVSIRTMLDELPEGIGPQFLQLHKKLHVAIVPVAGNGCTGCGMGLPVSLVQQVRRSDSLHRCPNCSRFLFWPDTTPPRTLPRARWRAEPPKVGIARFSAPELMVPRLEASTPEAAIVEISDLMQDSGFIDNGTQLAEAALRREAIVSTAIEHGIAFPHARGVEGGGLTLALALAPTGIRFSSEFRELTRIIFFMSIPTAASAFYLKLLAGLTGIFEASANRKKLLDAGTPAKLWKTLAQLTKKVIT